MRVLCVLAVGAGLLTSSVAIAQNTPPRHYAPASKWAMEYADDSCRLIRNFSDGGDEITLAIERFAPGPVSAIGLAGKTLQVWPKAEETSYSFGRDGAPAKSPLQLSALADGRTAYVMTAVSMTGTGMPAAPAQMSFGPPPAGARGAPPSVPTLAALQKDELARAAAVDTLSIRSAFKEPMEFELGPMADAVRAMQQCTNELVTHWGVDPQANLSLSRPVMPADPAAFGKALFLEKWMMGAGKTSFVRYRLAVDGEGKPTHCTVLTASAPQQFRDDLCAALSSVSFLPALDAAQKPVPSYFLSLSVVKTR